MKALIRIKGMNKIEGRVEDTLYRLRLRRKYACVIVNESKEKIGMIKKVKDFIAYGEIDNDTLEELINKRGKPIDRTKKIDPKKILIGLKEGKEYESLNLKPFFRLHPPRGGIDGKVHFGKGKGVLGNNGKEINKLIKRML